MKTFQYADIFILKTVELVYFDCGHWVQCLFPYKTVTTRWFLTVGQLFGV